MVERERLAKIKDYIYLGEITRMKDWEWLIEKVELMNDSLHDIQIISSTMEDTEQVNEIFNIADKAQLD